MTSESSESGESPAEYPETVEFSGVGYTSLLPVHVSAALVILVGVILAVVARPEGFFALGFFLLIVLAFEAWMFRKSEKKLRLKLYLRNNPVEAYQGDSKVGDIDHGSIERDMDNPNDMGYRPLPKKNMIVWTFDSQSDKEMVAKRLLEYLPRDGDP